MTDEPSIIDRLIALEAKVNKFKKPGKQRFWSYAEVKVSSKKAFAELAQKKETNTSKLLAQLIDWYLFTQDKLPDDSTWIFTEKSVPDSYDFLDD